MGATPTGATTRTEATATTRGGRTDARMARLEPENEKVRHPPRSGDGRANHLRPFPRPSAIHDGGRGFKRRRGVEEPTTTFTSGKGSAGDDEAVSVTV